MKKISILLTVLTLIFLLPIAALAEGETETPSPSTTEGETETPSPSTTEEETETPTSTEPVVEATLEIDNEHIYEGMDKAFKDGYTPTVKDGKVTMVLPLVANGEIMDNVITVTPDLGGTESSPFVYSNYQKTVSLQDNTVSTGGAVSSYLVRFDFPLDSDRYNGVYTVTINVTAKAADGSSIEKPFTTYVTITDGTDPNAAEPTEKPETPTSQPKIIVSGYDINPSSVTAGEEFTATITLENTSEKKSVQNMAVTVSCDSTNLVLQNDSDTIYIDELKKEEDAIIKVTYKSDLETPPGQYNIMLNIEYDNSDAETLSSSGTVSVAVEQPLRVELETPQISDSVNAGDTMPLSFQVMNMGRSQVYNVRIELSAPGLIPSETAFIGNMEAGTAMSADMNVFVGTKNMSEGYEGEDKYGYTSGVITLIYEDAQGEEYTVETEFSTMINEPVIAPVSTEPEEEQETAGQWWISVIIGVVVIGGLAAFLIVRARKGKRNEDY